MRRLDEHRLLLVGDDPAWSPLVRDVATAMGVDFDIVRDVSSAIACMLRPDRLYGHVLATEPLQSREVDALLGMLDEATSRATPLLLLGSPAHPRPGRSGDIAVQRLHEASLGALRAILDAHQPFVGGVRSPLTARQLIAGLRGGGLHMRFQPILGAADLEPLGLEALARLHTRDGGVLHPKDFLPAARQCRCERVLTGIAAARAGAEIGGQIAETGLYVSVNLPMTTVMQDAAPERGRSMCAAAGVPPSRVMIEMLETSVAPDLPRLRRALDDWRRLGFRVAIDDAGPALPHWRALIDLPFDMLKLDGALLGDPTAAHLLESIVTNAKERRLFVLAEGIEDEADLARVRALQVDAVQGFLFARPLPAMAIPHWMNEWRGGLDGTRPKPHPHPKAHPHPHPRAQSGADGGYGAQASA